MALHIPILDKIADFVLVRGNVKFAFKLNEVRNIIIDIIRNNYTLNCDGAP